MKPATYRAALLTLCAAAALFAVAVVINQTGFGGSTPWYGAWGGYFGGSSEPFHLRVVSVDPGGPADRAGLRLGDLVDIRQQTVEGRFALLGQPLAEHPVTLSVRRGSGHAQLVIVPTSLDFRRFWNYAFNDFANLWLLLFAGVIAWRRPYVRGNLLLSTALAFVAIGVLTLPVSFVAPWAWASATQGIFGQALPLSMALWATLASTFARPLSLPRRVALGLCYVFVAFEMVAGMGVSDLTTGLAPTIAAITLWFDPVFFFGPWWTIPSFGALFAALVCCVLAIAASGGVDRQRAVWTLVPFAVLYCVWQVFGPAFEFLSYAAQLSVNYMLTFAFMTAPLALTYVALNRRLIDIGFVLNRTVVFTFVSIIVVAAFVLVEWLASEWFAGTSHQTSALIGMVVALALGLSLRYIHRYVDRFVDHVFFRKRHEDEVALRRFAHEAAFISDRSTLLSRAIQTVRRHTDADDATILIRNGAADYAPLGEAGRSVDENDPAFVVLRAWGKPVNIHAIEETKVRGEVAFPIVSRGDLLGALVCGPKRDGETYAPDESEALFALAHGVGTALGTLPHDDAAAGSAAEKLDLILDKLQSLERRSPG